jgi:hypothetical protein
MELQLSHSQPSNSNNNYQIDMAPIHYDVNQMKSAIDMLRSEMMAMESRHTMQLMSESLRLRDEIQYVRTVMFQQQQLHHPSSSPLRQFAVTAQPSTTPSLLPKL